MMFEVMSDILWKLRCRSTSRPRSLLLTSSNILTLIMVKISPNLKQKSLYCDTDIPFKFLKCFYSLCHITLGLDFGFIKFKCFRFVNLKMFTFIQSIIMSGWSIYYGWRVEHPLESLLQSCFMIQYLVHALILLRIKEETTLYNLIQNLHIIDSGLKVHHASYNWEIKLLSAILFSFLNNIFVGFMFYVWCVLPFDKWYFVMFHYLMAAKDIVRVSYALMFYAVNCRLRALGSLIKAHNSEFLSKQYLYKSIVDIAVQHKEAFDLLLVTDLLFIVPVVLSSIYVTVVKIKENQLTNLTMCIITEYASCFDLVILTVMPALGAGMLAARAEDIKLILHDLLLQPKCAAESGEIKRFIRYVKERGCRFRVWNLFPLDAGLLRIVFRFCITYLIVIIQFIYN